jgi:ABC-2 type transport system permease protein
MRKVRSPLIELTIARTKEFGREPEAIFWVFAFPILLALALGFAFRESKPERIPVGVVAGAPSSETILKSMAASPALKPRIFEREAGQNALRTGKISLLVEPQPLVFHFDPSRPDSRVARLEADDAIQTAAGRRPAVSWKERHVTEKGSRYIDFLLPGLLGMNLMGTGMWGIGFSIVNARTRKLLKRLIATPMRRSHYLMAQILSRFVFLVGEVVLLVGFGTLFFDVPLRGSMLLLALTCAIGAVAFSGLGLLVASRAQTIEAVSGLMNFVMLPMWLCSGVFFSADRFPDAAQPFIQLLPLTALNDALRGIMLEGNGLTSIASELAILIAWGAITFVVALRIFRWR